MRGFPSFPALLLLLFATTAHARPVVVTAVGDILLGASASPTLARFGYDYPFDSTIGMFFDDDIVVGNLEAPITARGTEFLQKKFRFRCADETASALKRAGFSVLTLANNHIMDFGSIGLSDTIGRLREAGLQHTGAGSSLSEARREALVSVEGKTFAFLAYSLTQPVEFFATATRAGSAPGYPGYVSRDIRRAREKADYVVVSFHWGRESERFPLPAQQEAARRAVDEGADLVIGHHPHVLQGVEIYRGAPILYSLGNFSFGSWSRSSARSVIARISFEGDEKTVELVPLNVANRRVRFRPEVLQGAKGREILRELRELSVPFGTQITESGGRYLVFVRGGRYELSAVRGD